MLRTTLAVLALILYPSLAEAGAACDSSSTVCYNSTTYPVKVQYFLTSSGSDYVLQISDLKNITGQTNTLDTVMWLLNVDAGTVVAVNDDYGGYFSSRIAFHASSAFHAAVVVAAYSNTASSSPRQGTCDLGATQDGSPISTPGWNDQVFGGWRLQAFDVKINDLFFVGVPPDGQDHTATGNKLFLFEQASMNCSSNCGSFVRSDSQVGGLARLWSNFNSSAASYLVGADYPSQYVSARVFHARYGSGTTCSLPYTGGGGWGSSSTYTDADCDGLPWQIEALNDSDQSLSVNTCDTSTGPSTDCSATVGRKFSARATWSPVDSDNDGLKDNWELFGVLKSCTSIPASPYYDPGSCSDWTFNGSAISGAWAPSNPLSGLDPNPRDVDAYVHYEYQTGNLMSSDALTMMHSPFETEGLQCAETTSTNPATCTGQLDNYNHVTVHSYQDVEISANNYETFGVSLVPALDYFNKSFPGYRKHTGIFRYGQSLNMGYAGIALGHPGRIFTQQGNGVSNDLIGETMSHELGHCLGLDHGGDIGNQNVPNYVSLMSYEPWAGLPPKANPAVDDDLWPDDFGTSCAGNPSACNKGGVCWLSADGGNNTCVPACTFQARFSRGLNATLNEANLTEAGQTTKFTAETFCNGRSWGGGGKSSPPALDPSPPKCDTGTTCEIDWNSNAVYTNTSVPLDLDGDGNSTTTFNDVNDWALMYDSVKSFGSDPHLPNAAYATIFRVYDSDFDNLSPNNISAYSHGQTVASGITVASAGGSYGSNYGNDLLFHGPCGSGCTPDSVSLSSDPAIGSMGRAVSGIGPFGFRVDLYAKFDDFSTASGHQLIYSNLFEIDVANSNQKARGWIDPGTGKQSLTSSLTLSTNTWYWITLTWDNSIAHIRVRKWLTGAWSGNDSQSACDALSLSYVSDVEPSDVVFGKYPPGASQWAMKGHLDQPRLMTGVQCLLNDDINAITCPSGGMTCSN